MAPSHPAMTLPPPRLADERLSRTLRTHWRRVLPLAVLVVTALALLRPLAAWVPRDPLAAHPWHRYSFDAAAATRQAMAPSHRDAWRRLARALERSRPIITTLGDFAPLPVVSVEAATAAAAAVGAAGANADADAVKLSAQLRSEPPDALKAASEADFADLRVSHDAFLRQLDELTLAYSRNTQGIVVAADGPAMAALVVQLRLLRRTGCKLPVEVVLPRRADVDEAACGELLPALRARCIVIEDEMGPQRMPRLPETNRRREVRAGEPLHKYLAAFFSSYEEVLVLDYTTLVLDNPDEVLGREPFLTRGLVLWPDFWLSTHSPRLFEVQGRQLTSEERRTRDGRTVDLGQWAISKRRHVRTLMLAVYYATFGDRLYDSLTMQSQGGERGSYALRAAAQRLGAPYYMCKRLVQAVGYPDRDRDDGGFRGVGMLQANPLDDFLSRPSQEHRALFLRANSPVLHPGRLLTADGADANVAAADGAEPPRAPDDNAALFAKTREHHRMWEWFSGRERAAAGWRTDDAEAALWAELAHVACELRQRFRFWIGAREAACRAIEEHRRSMGWA